jgi:hypothetical protein
MSSTLLLCSILRSDKNDDTDADVADASIDATDTQPS